MGPHSQAIQTEYHTGIGLFPHNSPIRVLDVDELQDNIGEIRSSYPTAKLLLSGDFNSPGINWHHKTLLDSYAPVSFREKLLEVQFYFLYYLHK